MAPTFQEAITQLEELGSNRQKGIVPCAATIVGSNPHSCPPSSPLPLGCDLPSQPCLNFSSPVKLSVSNTDLALSHLCCCTPIALCLEQNSSQLVTKAIVSFTSKMSLPNCLFLEYPRNPILMHRLVHRMNALPNWRKFYSSGSRPFFGHTPPQHL